ncbi:MAG: DNA polymerase III subunit delta [Alphaproteobacteria bacterium]|nr:DNA polymerase III subunit delta [Alphaproteobacteria bacterium]
MKLAPARIAAFLQRPDPAIRVILLYGPDAGLVRERADVLARSVCADLADPFRIADLNGAVLGADPARLADEAAQLSLVGGRRVVRVRAATDSMARIFVSFLTKMPGEALVVAEAAELSASSPLRRAFEAAPGAAAIGCYPDAPRDRAAVIRETLAGYRVTASRDATQYLVDHLGEDRLVTRSELHKLALFVGDGGRVGLEDAVLCVGDSAALELDDAVMAAAEGDQVLLDRVLDRVFQKSESPVTVVRAMLRHLHRLHGMVARVSAGGAIDEVVRSARPPIFFKHQDGIRSQLGRWREPALRTALAHLAEAEIHMKTTGLPAETLCREALLAVAQRAERDAARQR